MKAITITIPEELDKQAAREARRLGISKSELIREGLRAVLPGEPLARPVPSTGDPARDEWLRPLHEMSGFVTDGAGLAAGETVDDVLYPR